MKYLAIDYGLKRTGIAVSDPEGKMAFPRTTLHKTTRNVFFDELVDIITAEAPHAVVVGLPVDLQGAETLMTTQTRNFVGSLKRRVPMPVYWMKEVLSSHEAERDLNRAGLHGKAMKMVLDQQAAVRILETFLTLDESRRRIA